MTLDLRATHTLHEPSGAAAATLQHLERLLSLGASGDLLLLGPDSRHLGADAEHAAGKHSAHHRAGGWDPEQPGLTVVDLSSQPAGPRLDPVLRWAAGRAHRRPADRGIRFLILHHPSPAEAGHLAGIALHAGVAGIHATTVLPPPSPRPRIRAPSAHA